MTKPVRMLYEEAKQNTDFQSDLKSVEPANYKPGLFWSNEQKVLWATIYFGWLIGKGVYNENNYK